MTHLTLSALNLWAPGLPLGDVTLVYRVWAENAATGWSRMGIDQPWVYPILAAVPMTASRMIPGVDYGIAWLLVVSALNAAVFSVLLGWRGRVSRPRAWAAGWWLVFLMALGPIALARIDTVTVALSIAAMLYVRGRANIAALLWSLATWVKVWPAALFAAGFIAVRRRLLMLTVAISVSAVVVAVSVAAGAGWTVWGFITAQTSRGLQVESLGALPFLWAIVAGARGVSVEYNTDILTFEIVGPGADVVATWMTPLMLVLVGGVIALGVWAVRRGVHSLTLLPSLSLALTLALIVSNKVGSPQFVTWLTPAIVLALSWSPRRAAPAAVLAVAIAVLTHVVYPYLYGWLLIADPGMVAVLTIRGILEVVLFVSVVTGLIRAIQRRRPITSPEQVPSAVL